VSRPAQRWTAGCAKGFLRFLLAISFGIAAIAALRASAPAQELGVDAANQSPLPFASDQVPPSTAYSVRLNTRQPALTDPEADIPRGETVRDRPRQDYDPVGIPLGSFRAFPQLHVGEVYDDNIFRNQTDHKGDLITEIVPRLALASDWNRHALSFEADANIGKHILNPDEDYEDYAFRTNGRLDITHSASLDAGVGFEHLHQDRSSPDEEDGITPTQYTDLEGSLGFNKQFGRFQLRLESLLDRLNYRDDERLVDGTTENINNDDRDRYELFGLTKLGYEVSPAFQPFIGGGYGIIRYDDKVDDNGFNRSANRSNVVVGTDLDLGGVTSAELYMGYMSQQPEDDRFSTIQGPEFGGTLTWNVTRLTTVTADITRSIATTTLDGASGALQTGAGLTIEHELRRNILLQLNGDWQQSDFNGIDRLDNTYQAGIQGNYLINRNLSVTAGYKYQTRSSTDSSAEFSQNLVTLGLTAHF
jgi:hypothetical protein